MQGGDAASENNRGRLPFTWITTMRIQSWHNGSRLQSQRLMIHQLSKSRMM